jgi:hypothetical protein
MVSIFPICEVEGSWAFVCEVHMWAAVHTIIPFTFYYYFRSFLLNITLMALWEFIEGFSAVAFQGYWMFASDATNGGGGLETVGDSIISDGGMGLIGTLMAMMFVRLTDAPHVMPPRFPNNLKIWLKYFLQLLLFAAPTPAIQLYFSGGQYSIGFTTLTASYPVLVILFHFWNEGDPKYRHRYRNVLDGKGNVIKCETIYERYRPSQKKGRVTAGILAVGSLVYLVTMTKRYASSFFMVLINDGVVFGVLFFLTAFRYFYRNHHPRGKIKR